MRAAVRQARYGVAVGQHPETGVQRAIGIVQERVIQHPAPAVFEHGVERYLGRRAPVAAAMAATVASAVGS
jgi:hypothetical protein